MKTERIFVSIGGLIFEFSGDLPQLSPQSRLPRFFSQSAAPDICVKIHQTESLPLPASAQLLYTAGGLRMCALATRRFACYFNKNLPNAPDHAVLCYDTAAPDEMELFYRPVKRPLSEECLLSSLGLESVLLRHRRCILHASYICIDGKAILFTAPCGTGKSTQAELWKKFRGAKIINGDKALIRYDGERLLACGLPLCGSSEICLNEVFPIAAVVALAQEKKNSAARLRGGKAVKAVLPQIYTQPCEVDAVNGAFSAAISLAERAPIYFLRCLPDESAVECLEKALNKEI